MPTAPFDFAHVLGPVSAPSFFDLHWERQPLHVKRDRIDYYNDVLTVAVLEQLIASPDLRYPAIQLSKGGSYFPPEVYTDDIRVGSDHFTGVPNVQKIAAEYRAGATVVLPALQRTWPPLGALCANIEAELSHVVHGNAYLTPGNTAGFTPHYDTHEVLVLQIAGRKRWRIYPPPVELPHRRQPFSPIGYQLPSKSLYDVDLAPGDLLYLPRGYIHTTTTADEPSAHVTIGIAVYTWLDLAGELLQSAVNSSRFRKALPPGFAARPELRPVLDAGLRQVLDDLVACVDASALIERFLSRHPARPAGRAPFRFRVTVIEASTRLFAPAAHDYQITEPADLGGKIVVAFQQRRFVLPGEAQPAMEAMRTRPTFTAAELPGFLDLEAKLALVRQLVEKGFLRT